MRGFVVQEDLVILSAVEATQECEQSRIIYITLGGLFVEEAGGSGEWLQRGRAMVFQHLSGIIHHFILTETACICSLLSSSFCCKIF